MVLWMHNPKARDGIIAKIELRSWYPKFRALTKTICSQTLAEILRIREGYHSMYKAYFEEGIAQETIGPHQKV